MSMKSVASSFNQPPLIVGLGIGLWTVGIPYIKNQNLSYKQLQWLNLLTYGLNFVSTSIPGRIDGQQAKELSSSGMKPPEGSTADAMSPMRGKSLVTPSGWAFSIWGPIFIGEMIHVLKQFWVPETSKLGNLIKDTSISFSSAQIFQCLWCASFRAPKYEGSKMFISTAMLSSIALCFKDAHSVYSSSSSKQNDYTTIEYILHFLPMTLHYGWTTAASLVNLNGSVAAQEATPAVMAGVGHASALFATLVGMFTTITNDAPVYGSVISWALTAVGDSIHKRIQKSNKDDDDDEDNNLFGAIPQYYISISGSILCAITSIIVTLKQQQQHSK